MKGAEKEPNENYGPFQLALCNSMLIWGRVPYSSQLPK